MKRLYLMTTLAGKTAVILGASGSANFGSAIARRLAAEGASIVVAARREQPLQQLATELGGIAVACDVTRDGDIENLFAVATETYGRVDIAVYSAGIHTAAAIAEMTADDIRPTLEISVVGALLFFRHAAAAMTEGGSVITISSLTARIPGPGLAAYSTARAGIDYAIKVAAIEYGTAKVRFNSIAAGLIQTDMTDGFFAVESILDAHINATPCGRMGTLDDMAEAALFLADGQRSGYINGQVLDLAGGQQNGSLPNF
jgi:NAD(P)-dependent dehydrogenase (short-subunit alcohol dehydrogenase family)